MKTVKTTITTALVLISLNAFAQEKPKEIKTPKYKIVGKEIVKIENEDNKFFEKTDYTHTVEDSIKEVFKTTKGKLFVFKFSKKTGKKYKFFFSI